VLLPFRRMRERIDLARKDSDTTLFYDLLSYGEMVVKFTVAGLLAAVPDDRSRSRYRHIYNLVRARQASATGTMSLKIFCSARPRSISSSRLVLCRESLRRSTRRPLGNINV